MMRPLKILEWGQRFIMTEGGQAWEKRDHQRTYTLTATHLIPVKAMLKRMGW